MENKDLLILFEGDDMEGISGLLSAFINIRENYNFDYCIQEVNLVGNFMTYEAENRKNSMSTLIKIVKFLRKNFDIVIICVGIDTKNNIYEQFLKEQGADLESIHEVMQIFKSQQLRWLNFINNICVSDKKYETIFCSVDECNNKEDFINKAKELKEEIEKKMVRN